MHRLQKVCGEYRETYQVIFGDGITLGIVSELPLIRSYQALHIVHISCSFGVLVGQPLGGVRIMSVSRLYRERAVTVVIQCVSCAYRVHIVCVSDGVYRVCL